MAFLLQHLLSESAARLPDKEALRFKDESLTYGEFDKLTNQVARALRAQGVRRGDRVGIYVNKSPASVISIFGILKAGGAYVPLDPNAPAKRLSYMTRNCDIRVLLSAADKLTKIPLLFEEGTPIQTVVLIGEEPAGASNLPDGITLITQADVQKFEDCAVPDPGTIETDLAYLLYTSGSTGDPKGVMISHRTIFTFINWCYETFQVNETDRVTSHAPLHFDLSTFDIYVTIKAGGTVVLLPETLSVIPTELARLLQDERITRTYLVPSLLSMLVNYGQIEKFDLSSLRTILFAGEVFPIKYLRKLVQALPDPDYYNLYGPTETNVCTYYKVRPEDIAPERTQPVSIGKACENIEVFAVDDQGNVVTKPGIEGELWVRGSCVAQGYWGDPEKTKRGFVPNPHQPHFHEIAYRTGDIVYLDEDAENWIFIGRRDFMIKSRGYRIEIGDIEAALYSHPAVLETAVVAVPDDLIGNRIKAYVVLKEAAHATSNDLMAHCRDQLQRYMVPETIVFESSLPKTSTGKINRPLLAQSDKIAKA